MTQIRDFIISTLIGGLLVVAPIYFAFLLLLRATQSLEGVVGPLAQLLPAWFPAEHVLSLLLVLVVCFLIGLAGRTRMGRSVGDQIESTVFEKIPGFSLFRSLTQQLVKGSEEKVWKPALVEIEEALVPAFIIEELADGRFTVFVPSVPTPFAGAVYILTPERVHPVDVPFAQAIQTVARWGSGSKDLVAAMKRNA